MALDGGFSIVQPVHESGAYASMTNRNNAPSNRSIPLPSMTIMLGSYYLRSHIRWCLQSRKHRKEMELRSSMMRTSSSRLLVILN